MQNNETPKLTKTEFTHTPGGVYRDSSGRRMTDVLDDLCDAGALWSREWTGDRWVVAVYER